jgi:hypothetical protein
MGAFLYEFPATNQKVQGWFADDVSENSDPRYETVTCLACRGVHLVNPKTGKTLGADKE